MAAIKRFFEKRKLDVKFKRAGGGHKLTEDTRSVPTASSSQRPQVARQGSSDAEKQRAAQAAMARMNQPKTGDIGTSMYSVKRQVQQEIEAEKKAAEKAHRLADVYSAPKEVELEAGSVLSVTGVFYKCPLIGQVVLPKKEMELHIHEFLLSQLAEEPEMTSALMIYTLNKDPEKVKVCVDTICKYLDNITANPQEEKFRKIRINNKVFQDRVIGSEGAQEFLQSTGFQMKSLPGPNQVNEDFYVLDVEQASNTDRLKGLKDVLLAAEPIKPELDRNATVLTGNNAASGRMQVPDEFYRISPEEMKKEQQVRQEVVERLGMLRTKEMRERERQKDLRRYRYTLLRVRFPDGVILQGTFHSHERLEALFEFVRECLEMDWIPFALSVETGSKLNEDKSSLAEVNLVPAAVVNFSYDATVLAEITAQQGSSKILRYVKLDVMECGGHY